MAFSDLPVELQADIAVADKSVRGSLSGLRQMFQGQDWELIRQVVNRIVAHPDFAALGDGDLIPNSTTLGSAEDATKAQWVSMWTFLNSDVYGTLIANMPLLSTMIGVNA